MSPSFQVCYFGLLADRRGLAEERIIRPVRTPAELFESLNAEFRLGMPASACRVAVNDEFVSWNHPLKDGDSIAFLPPMSGG